MSNVQIIHAHRRYHFASRVVDYGLPCPSCGKRYGHKVTHTYPETCQRRVRCSGCNESFVVYKLPEKD